MHSQDHDLHGEILDNRFRVLEVLGRGGMGIVWRVQHIGTKQLFALKTLHDSAPQRRKLLKRVLYEARATAAVQSKHVVRIVDVKLDCQHRGIELPFIVMELLEGRSFSCLLDDQGVIAASELLWVMAQVSKGLAAAHQRGIIHRDLKPSNVFLARSAEGQVVVKLCDFGIAKLQGAALLELGETGTLSTETGAVLGTPRYMAPEQLRRNGIIGPATDQWAFAQIAFRALSGRNYFGQVNNGAELVLAIVHEPLPLPSTLSQRIPERFNAWFLRSCARDPKDRFPDVMTQFDSLQQSLGSPSHKSVVWSTPESSGRSEGQSVFPASRESDGTGHGLQRRPFRRDLRRIALVLAGSMAALGTRYLVRLPLFSQNDSLGRGDASTSRHDGQASRVRGNAPSVPLMRVVPGNRATDPPKGGTMSQVAPIGSRTSRIEISSSAPTSNESTATSNSPKRAEATRTSNRQPQVSRSVRAVHEAPKLLPKGASCLRSAQCEGGLCAAEECQ